MPFVGSQLGSMPPSPVAPLSSCHWGQVEKPSRIVQRKGSYVVGGPESRTGDA